MRNSGNPSTGSGQQDSNYDEYRRQSKKSMHRIIAFTEKMRFEQKFAEHKIEDDQRLQELEEIDKEKRKKELTEEEKRRQDV